MADLQRHLIERLEGIIAAQHPAVQESSSELLATPHITNSVFYGYAIRNPYAYVEYVKEQLSQTGRLPTGVELTPDNASEEELEELRSTANIHRQRLPAPQDLAHPSDPAVETQDAQQGLIRREEEYHAETLRLTGASVQPPMNEARDRFWRDQRERRAQMPEINANLLGTDTLSSLLAQQGPGRAFPGFRAPTQNYPTSAADDSQEPVDFRTHCVWCFTKFQENDAQQDREPSRVLPCGHVVGAVCSQASGQPDKCPFRCV